MRFRSSWLRLATFAVGAVLAVAPGSDLGAQGQGQGLAVGRPEWTAAVRHDTSRPLREIPGRPAVSTRRDFEVKQAPALPISGAPDTAVQAIVVAPLAATAGIGFDGIGENSDQVPGFNVNYAPPDTVGEAGLTQFVQWVNPAFAIFNKATGALLYGPVGGNTLWTDFGGPCESLNDGDPIVQYDQLADRWVMTQFALQAGNYMQCVAISVTDDATGEWHRYAFSYDEFPDYPKLSVWPDAYYITFNMFNKAGLFSGGRVCAYDRAKMILGQPATQVCYQIPYGSLLAADLEGKTPPPANSPNYVLNRGSNSLNLWKFKPNFTSPSSSTFVGPTSIPVSAFTAACGRSCIPQPSTTQTLDALGDRLMYRLSYRNLGAREVLLVNHSVVAGSVIGVRWYDITISGGLPSVRQQSTYAPADGRYRWMGSIAMDQAGNVGLGYSIGSASMKASIRFAGRSATDPLNTLSMDENLQTGTGSQLATLSRWGDYSTMSIDPADDCTFWYTSEYLKTDGTFNWSTRIGSFKFDGCGQTSPDFTIAATPSSSTVTQGGSANYTVTVTPTNNYSGGGTITAGLLPAGVTATFPQGQTFGGSTSTSRTLTLETSGTTLPGTYNITVNATDGTLTHSTTVALVVNAPVVPDFTMTASPASRTVKRGRSTTYTITVTPSGGLSGETSLSLTSGPGNTSYTFAPASVTSGTSTLTVGTTNTTTKGTHTLVITGINGALQKTVSVTLKVQ